MNKGADIFNEMFGKMTGDKKYDTHGYHCTRCGYELDRIVVETSMKEQRKLFYCTQKKCPVFGIVTVVAKKKLKS